VVSFFFLQHIRVTVCSYFERKYIAKETKQVAPMSAYPLLTICLMSSSSLSNMALNYINFPTKVVFRSCKLIPTMIIASIIHKKIFSSVEYTCAVAVCLGLVMFAAAEWDLSPTFHPIGLAFVSLSVCADAILPNAQERLFRLGSTRLEVTCKYIIPKNGGGSCPGGNH
jgi:adenosine 3'-phospho 5'-phosphosulfate transporter B3